MTIAEIEVAYRVLQISTFGLLFWLMGRQLQRRKAARDHVGQDQFKAFMYMVAAMLVSVLIGLGAGIQINWASALVVLTALNCVRTLKPFGQTSPTVCR